MNTLARLEAALQGELNVLNAARKPGEPYIERSFALADLARVRRALERAQRLVDECYIGIEDGCIDPPPPSLTPAAQALADLEESS